VIKLKYPALFLFIGISLVIGCSSPSATQEGGDLGIAEDIVANDVSDLEVALQIDAGPQQQLQCIIDDDCLSLLSAHPPCTLLTCSDDGLCVPSTKDDGQSCISHELCYGEGICAAGQCEAAQLICDDQEPCTEDSCDPELGCQHLVFEGPCDDGDPCTPDDYCSEGVCVPGGELACDDNDPCTNDECDRWGGCISSPASGACDDGDDCTVDDQCSVGICTGIEICECRTDLDCGLKTDLCTPELVCDVQEVPFSCVPVPDTQVICPAAPPCLLSSCDAYTGECLLAPELDGGACQDLLGCVSQGICEAGVCVGAPLLCEADSQCLTGLCVPGQGCIEQPLMGFCDDDDPCSVNDLCIDGLCAGTPGYCEGGPAALLRVTELQVQLPFELFYLPSDAKLAMSATLDAQLAELYFSQAQPNDMLLFFDKLAFDLPPEQLIFGVSVCERSEDGLINGCPLPASGVLVNDLDFCITAEECAEEISQNGWPGFMGTLPTTASPLPWGDFLIQTATISGLFSGAAPVQGLELGKLRLFIPADTALATLVTPAEGEAFTLADYFSDETQVQVGETMGWWLRLSMEAQAVSTLNQ
jgi:Dictyostelium (slime mold) repeat